MDELVDKIQVDLGVFHVLRMDVLMIDGWDDFFFLAGQAFVLITINILDGNEEMHN